MTRRGFPSPATAAFCEMVNMIRALASEQSSPTESSPAPAEADV